MTEPPDEDLHQPRRRVGAAALTSLVGAALAAGVLVVALDRDDPAPPRPTSTATPTPDPQPSASQTAVPRGVLLAVRAAYPRAELVEVGVAVPVRATSDRNYQFLAGPRRITVVVGPADPRPEVQTTGTRDVLIVAKRSGRRVVVTVRTFRGTLRPADVRAARRLIADARLLAAS